MATKVTTSKASTSKTSSKKGSTKAKVTKSKVAKTVASEIAASYPRPRYVFDEQKITKLVKINPSREGTKAHENWAMITNGMTVGKYLEKGGSIKDLRANLHRGNIELK